MPNRPKPTSIRIIEGNPGHRPINKSEPKAKVGTPERPKGMSNLARKEWDRIVPELLEIGVLSNIDRVALEAYCETYAEWHEAQKSIKREGLIYKTAGGLIKRNPAVVIRADAQRRLKGFLIEFGLTPASRSRISTEATQQATTGADPWADLA